MVAEAVFAHADEGELGGIGLSKDDGSRIFHPFDDGGVLLGYAVFEQEEPVVVGMPLVIWVSLTEIGRPWRGPSRRLALWRPRQLWRRRGLVVGDEKVGVELGIQAVDTFEEEFGEFYGRHLLGGDELEQVCGGGVCEFLVRHGEGLLKKGVGAVGRRFFHSRSFRRVTTTAEAATMSAPSRIVMRISIWAISALTSAMAVFVSAMSALWLRVRSRLPSG